MRTSLEIRQRLIERLAFSITRPNMMTTTHDLDGYFRILLDDLAFIDGAESIVQAAFETIIRERRLWSSTGTLNTVGELMPRRVVDQVRASIWAEVAYSGGWVNVDSKGIRRPEAWDEARSRLQLAIDGDLTGQELADLVGDPSISSTSWLGFVDESGRWFHVDLDRYQEPSETRSHGRYVGTDEAMVVALRSPADTFAEGLMLTPFGTASMS